MGGVVTGSERSRLRRAVALVGVTAVVASLLSAVGIAVSSSPASADTLVPQSVHATTTPEAASKMCNGGRVKVLVDTRFTPSAAGNWDRNFALYSKIELPAGASTVNLTASTLSYTQWDNAPLWDFQGDVVIQKLDGTNVKTIGHYSGLAGFTTTNTMPANTTAGLYQLKFSGYTAKGTFEGDLDITVSGLDTCPPVSVPDVKSCDQPHAGDNTGVHADPVLTMSGDVFEEAVDLAIPGRSTVGFGMARSYGTWRASTNGPLGYGWTHKWATRLVENAGTATIECNGGTSTFYATTGGQYTQDARNTSRLVKNTSTGVHTLTRANGDVLTFDSSGRLTSWKDRNNYAITLTHTNPTAPAVSQLDYITDPSGRALDFQWNGTTSTSKITKVTEKPDGIGQPAVGRSVSYGYKNAFNTGATVTDELTEVVDVGGAKWGFEYDTNHRLTKIRDPKQSLIAVDSDPGTTPKDIVNVYDGSGRVTSQTDNRVNPARTTQFNYTTLAAEGGVIITDPAGNKSVDYYTNGRRIKVTNGYTTSSAITFEYTYDPATGAVATVKNLGTGVVTASSTYDAKGNLTGTTDALLRTMTFADYNAFGLPGTITSPARVVTTNTYDSNGNLQTTCTPKGTVPAAPAVLTCASSGVAQQSTTINRNPAQIADVTSIVDANNKTTTFEYDTYGNRTTVIDPLGNKSNTVYDKVGRVDYTISPKGNKNDAALCAPDAAPCPAKYKTDYTTGLYGEVTEVVDPLGNPSKRSYDVNGNLQWTRTADDPNGTSRQTTYVFDGNNELLEIQRPVGTLKNEYWPDGRLKKQIDAALGATQYDYDPAGRLKCITDPNTRVTKYDYDAAGDLKYRRDPVTGATCAAPGPISVTYTYDNAGQLKAMDYAGSTSDVSNIQYDNAGRRTAMTDGTGVSSWTWDSLGRLASTTDGANSTVGYGWDLRGSLKWVKYPGGTCEPTPGDRCATYTVDDAGRTTAVSDWLGNTFTYTPDENGNYKSIIFPNASGETDVFSFDRADRMTGAAFNKGATVLGAETYGRTATGSLSSITNRSGLPGAANQYFGYTGNDQLCYVAGAAGTNPTCATPPSGAQTYQYDAADNLTKTLNGTVQKMDPANQLCYTAPAGSPAGTCTTPPSGATTYGHDDRGNRTVKAPPTEFSSEYAYDQENRLTSATVPSSAAKTGGYTPVTPARVWDSRVNGSPVAQLAANGGTKDVVVTGANGVPATGVAAVVVTLTATGSSGAGGYLSTYPAAATPPSPLTSTLNYQAGQTISNTAVVKVSASGAITVLNGGGTSAVDFIIDIQGWYGDDTGTFTPLNPLRAFDSRVSSGGPGPQTTRTVQIAGTNGIPATGVASVAVNITVAGPTTTGWVNAYANGITAPTTNMMSYTNGQTIAGMAMVGVGTDGKIKIDSLTAVDIIIDIQGWTATTASDDQSDFVSRAPARLLDTRTTGGIINAGATRTVQVTGALFIPVGATAVSVNITAVDGSGSGALAAYPNDIAFPGVSNVNFNNASPIANAAIVKLSSDGKLKLQAIAANTHVVIDVTGWYQPATDTWTYTYDGDGNRQTKTGRPSRLGLSGTTRFTWGKAGNLSQLLVETRTAATTGGNTDTIWYIYGPDGLPVEQVLANNTTTVPTTCTVAAQNCQYIHHDQLGSSRLVTNIDGTVIGSGWTYDPYGNITHGTQRSNLGYAGQYRDAETGLYYMRARYYDPASAQFITRDPLASVSRSRYGYANGTPLNLTDPSGLYPGEGWVNGAVNVVTRGNFDCLDILDANCESIAEQHPEGSQQVANFAGGVVNGLSLGNGRNVLNLATDSGNKVDWNSGWSTVGTGVGLVLMIPFAAHPQTVTLFSYAARGAALGGVYQSCANPPGGGFDAGNCAGHAAIAALFFGYGSGFRWFGADIENLMGLPLAFAQGLFDMGLDAQC